MIQRFIYTALVDGFQAFTDDPTLIDALFMEEWELSETESDSIKEHFAAHPPTIKHGYARMEDDFPIITIVLGGEGEAQTVLGDDLGMVLDEDDPDYQADIAGALWQHTYQIMVYTEHPDLTTYYYEMVKRIMITTPFINNGLFEIKLRGNDLMPDPAYIPAHLFVRQFTFDCQREFHTVDRNSRLSKAFAVRGIHVDKSGSPRDVGGVQTLVTVSGVSTDE